MNAQTFLFPADLFADQPSVDTRPWACVRTRARFEKQFCAWLKGRGVPHFLPTAHVSRRCGRTRYAVDAPLFSGYVFLIGDHDRSALKDARCVVDVLRPESPGADHLERDLWTIWRGLVTGSRLELAKKLLPGDTIEITTPPYAGMIGRFERWGTRGRLHVWLDIMGCGAIIELPESDVARVV